MMPLTIESEKTLLEQFSNPQFYFNRASVIQIYLGPLLIKIRKTLNKVKTFSFENCSLKTP